MNGKNKLVKMANLYRRCDFRENRKNLKKKGEPYDAHHIIENSYRGEDEWWNIYPAKFPNEHQAGIHGSGSPGNKLLMEVNNMKYDYLVSNKHNSFYPVALEEIEEVEEVLGLKFPKELKDFFLNVGYGFIKGSKYNINRIMDPYSIRDFRLKQNDYEFFQTLKFMMILKKK